MALAVVAKHIRVVGARGYVFSDNDAAIRKQCRLVLLWGAVSSMGWKLTMRGDGAAANSFRDALPALLVGIRQDGLLSLRQSKRGFQRG